MVLNAAWLKVRLDLVAADVFKADVDAYIVQLGDIEVYGKALTVIIVLGVPSTTRLEFFYLVVAHCQIKMLSFTGLHQGTFGNLEDFINRFDFDGGNETVLDRFLMHVGAE